MTAQAPDLGLPITEPTFLAEARRLALQLSTASPEELARWLKVNPEIAAHAWQDYQRFFADDTPRVPAAFAYDGMVFRKLAPETLPAAELLQANERMLIASFLYGLLRPLDGISRYRLEGSVRLSDLGGDDLFAHWRPLLTNYFISRIQACGGVLLNLASAEMQRMVDWRRVGREVRVVTPEFHVLKGGKWKNIVIYTKMCRGAMARFVLQSHIDAPEELAAFSFEGFRHAPEAGPFSFRLS